MQTAFNPTVAGLWAASSHDGSFFRTALDAVDEAVAVCEIAARGYTKDAIVYANPAFGRWSASSGAQLVSGLWGDLTDRAQWKAKRDAVVGGTPIASPAVLYPGGKAASVSEQLIPLADLDGRVSHYLLIVRPDGMNFGSLSVTELTAATRELFAEFDPAGLVRSLTRAAKALTGASSAHLYASSDDGAFFGRVFDLGAAAVENPRADAFIVGAFAADNPVVDETRGRVAVRIAQTDGAKRILYAQQADGAEFSPSDLFVLGLLAQYFAVAARNVELFNELESRRAAILELSSIKSDLIAMLAHDFASPLTSIAGYTDLLIEHEGMPAECVEYLETIKRSAERLSTLARDTLTISRLERNEFELTLEPVDVVAQVREVAAALAAGRAVNVHALSDRLVVRADKARLRQVFENVVGNAIKYSPNGEQVDIAVRRRSGRVRITVRDRGIGIPGSDRHAIFTRFLRASNARRMGIAGSGFGLYLSRMLIERLGGRITFASRPGRGTSFSIELPLGYARTGPPQTRRVLLVDRDGDARSFTAHSLRLVNYSVRTVDGVEAALAALSAETFDVAIFDFDSIGAWPSAADLKGVASEGIKLVSLSGDRRSEESGWDVHLTKPFMARDLQRAVEAALGVEPADSSLSGD
jgi:signal transduction histidine kinase